MNIDPMDDSESDSSESAGVALNMMSNVSAGERMHPALQAQLLRAQQRRVTTSLHAIQSHPQTAAMLQNPSHTFPSAVPAAMAMHQPILTQTLAAVPRQPMKASANDDTNVYDPFAAAGLDLQSERHTLNAMNEVASAVESRRMLSTRQVHDEQFFVRQIQLKTILLTIAKKRGLIGVSDGVCELVTLALQEHLEDVIEQLVIISKRRMDEQKDILPIEICSEPHQHIKRIQKAEEEQKRHFQQQERILMLEAARLLKESQGKEEEIDARTAEKIKMLEEEEKERQKLTDINDAALLAIGGGAEFSFKKKSTPATSMMATSSAAAFPAVSSFLPASSLSVRDDSIQRQLTLQDCIHYLERDYHTTKSNLLFKLYQRVGVSRPRR